MSAFVCSPFDVFVELTMLFPLENGYSQDIHPMQEAQDKQAYFKAKTHRGENSVSHTVIMLLGFVSLDVSPR
jgi:hypothetical protein